MLNLEQRQDLLRRRAGEDAAAYRDRIMKYGKVGFITESNVQPYIDSFVEEEIINSTKAPSNLQSFMAGGADGAAFGFADELLGIGSDETKGRIREQLKASQEENPYATMAGQATGAIASTLALGGLPVVGAGAANLYRGAGWLKSALLGSGTGAVASAIHGAGSGENPEERLEKAMSEGAAGAVGGLVLGPAGHVLGKAGEAPLSPLVQKLLKRNVVDASGNFTDFGRQRLAAAGFDEETVSALSDRFKQQFADEARRSSLTASPEGVEQAARKALLDTQGIPAYRHNITEDLTDQADYARALRGGAGQEAQQIVQAADDAQRSAVSRAADDLAVSASPARQPSDQFDAAEKIQNALRTKQANMRGEARAAYNELEASGAAIKGTAVQNLGETVQNAVRMSQSIRINELTPTARASVDFLNNFFEKSKNGSVSFDDIERARQALIRNKSAAYSRSIGTDQIAMDEIVNAFDDQVDNMIQSAMMSGDGSVLDLAKKARSAWSRYMSQFRGKGAASKFIQKMVDEDASPDQVAQWMFSAGRLGTGQMNSTIAKGLKKAIGEDSAEWSMLQQGAIRQLIMDPSGGAKSPQVMAKEIRRFLGSPNTRQLSRELFTPQQRGALAEFEKAMGLLVPKPGAVNYSGSGYEASRAVAGAITKLTSALGFSSGGIAGGAAGYLAGSAARSLSSRSGALSAVSGPKPVSKSFLAGAASVPASAAGAEEIDKIFSGAMQR